MKKFTRRYIARTAGLLGAIGLTPGHAKNFITPEQVEGPFYPFEEQPDNDLDLTQMNESSNVAKGEKILVRGRVLDASGQPVPNAEVDVWQANAAGRYTHIKDPNPAPLDPDFRGFGIMQTSDAGSYSFKTIKPGAYPLKFLGGEGWRCQHIHFKVAAPGYKPLITQMYFDGDPRIETDEEIAKAPASLRHLLIIAEEQDSESHLPLFKFNIVLAKT